MSYDTWRFARLATVASVVVVAGLVGSAIGSPKIARDGTQRSWRPWRSPRI